MLAEERRRMILSLLEKNGSVRTQELAQRFGVSDQTIRRDFWELEDQGLVDKGHGGAVLVNYHTVPYRDRAVLRQAEKLAIAGVAASLATPGMTVALGPGTTTEAVAHRLNGVALHILTNSVVVARAVTQTVTKVSLTGGQYRPGSELVTGDWSRENLETCFVDLAFVGVSGIGAEEGYTVTQDDEAAVLRGFIRIAKTAVVVSDSSKFGRVGKASVAPLGAVHKLMTDLGIAAADREMLLEKGVDVVTAAPDRVAEGTLS
ncbi:DeoR/GlpR family DNA-binding transcription regulator [soil metagenome]